MNIIKTEIPGVLIIEPKVFGDARGYFFESWNQAAFEAAGITNKWVQDNESKSCFGVLRGLHYQAAPYTQAKIVRVIVGAVLDVAVDIRKNSPTYGKHVEVELSAENKRQLFIPRRGYGMERFEARWLSGRPKIVSSTTSAAVPSLGESLVRMRQIPRCP